MVILPRRVIEAFWKTGLDWQSRAACQGMSTALFFCDHTEDRDCDSTHVEHKLAGIAVCMGCPVRTECLDFAMRNTIRFGIWGGTTAQDRKRLRLGRVSA